MIKMSRLLLIFFFFSTRRLLHCHLCRGQFVLNTWQEQEQKKQLKQWERKNIFAPCCKKILTRTSDSQTGRRSGRCTALHSAQCCCCSHSLGRDTGDLHWPVRSNKANVWTLHLFWWKKINLLNSKTRGEDKFYVKVKDLWTVWE